ncbi:sulfatase [Thalassoglobus sp.]|uniref:sulfatase n=1 Tax=Thalassoglobus sp. TaxID=2795869 RepID=UPI003AA95DE1
MNTFHQNVQSAVAHVFPTMRLAILCTLMMAVECSILLISPGQPFQAGGPIPWVVLFWLMWFWLTASWGIYFVGRLLKKVENRPWWQNTIIKTSIGLLGCFLLLLHICSWGLFKQVGLFANLEAYRFLIINPPMSIWRDLTESEKIVLATTLLVVAGCFILSSRLLNYFTSVKGLELDPKKYATSRRIAFQLVTILLLIPSWVIASDGSRIRRATWYQIVKTRMHPVTTLSLSAAEQFFLEPIQPVIEEGDLVSLDEKWSPPLPHTKKPSVIILAVESLRADTVHLKHQGREVLPNINRLAREGVEFTSAYSQSTHSDYADVCIISSLYPLRTREHHYYTTADPWPKTLAFDLFKEVGYSTAIISSQNEGWGNMDQFLETPSLDLFYDAARSGINKRPEIDNESFKRDPGFVHELRVGALTTGKLEDRQTMDRALDWLNEKVEADEPFFLSMNFQSSHFPYEVPEDEEQPFQPAELAADVSFMEYPEERTPQVKNAYYNGIHQCDHQIGRMVRELEKLKILDDVILIVLGENGEALNENGYCGHAQKPVQPMIHVATIIRAPEYLEPATDNYPLEHIDVIPTVLGMLDWNPHPNFQGTDIFAEDRVPLEDRLLYFHVNNCSNEAEAVILGGRWKLMKDHHWQNVHLYDLKTDPGETNDIIEEEPELARQLLDKVEMWRENQLAYYHYSNYFSKYYPPHRPMWKEGLSEIDQ